MGMTERLTGTAGRITVTNPFDTAEVGTVADMSAGDAQTLCAPAAMAQAPVARCPATHGRSTSWA